MKYLGTMLRALFAGAVAFFGALGAALTSDQGFGDLSAQTWCVVIVATLVAFGGVYGITNKPA
jgi:hypothetical protein